MSPQPLTREERGHEATRNALAILERSLASMTRRRAEYGPNFHFYAEQVVEEILKLRGQLDDLIGLTAFIQEFGPPPPADGPARPAAAASVGPTPEPSAVPRV